MEKIVFVCIATGEFYGLCDLYLNRMHGMLAANVGSPFELICYSDKIRNITKDIRQIDCSSWTELDRPGMRPTTRKIGLFNPDYAPADWIVYLDLTLIIRKNLSPMLELMQENKNHLVIMEDWHNPTYNSCVMSFKPSRMEYIYKDFKSGVAYEQKVQGDQEFIYNTVMSRQRKPDVVIIPQRHICSFKQAVRTAWFDQAKAKSMVDEALIVKFHGTPRMHEAFSASYKWRKFRLKAWRRGMWNLPFNINDLEASWKAGGRHPY